MNPTPTLMEDNFLYRWRLLAELVQSTQDSFRLVRDNLAELKGLEVCWTTSGNGGCYGFLTGNPLPDDAELEVQGGDVSEPSKSIPWHSLLGQSRTFLLIKLGTAFDSKFDALVSLAAHHDTHHAWVDAWFTGLAESSVNGFDIGRFSCFDEHGIMGTCDPFGVCLTGLSFTGDNAEHASPAFQIPGPDHPVWLSSVDFDTVRRSSETALDPLVLRDLCCTTYPLDVRPSEDDALLRTTQATRRSVMSRLSTWDNAVPFWQHYAAAVFTAVTGRNAEEPKFQGMIADAAEAAEETFSGLKERLQSADPVQGETYVSVKGTPVTVRNVGGVFVNGASNILVDLEFDDGRQELLSLLDFKLLFRRK